MSVPFRGIPAPHFRLHSEATASPCADRPAGRWRFVLQSADGRMCLEAEDDEPETSTERLQLLAIVRALESLDEPARVTLVAPGRSITRGIRYGVAQWRDDDWHWERYGKLAPVKNGDLWRRIDRAMAIHDIVCHEAPAATDDLAEAIATRSVSEEVCEPADVRIIRRTHRGRKLRIDRVPAGRNSIPSRTDFKSVPRPHSRILHWCAELTSTFARLLRPPLRRSRPPLFDHAT